MLERLGEFTVIDAQQDVCLGIGFFENRPAHYRTGVPGSDHLNLAGALFFKCLEDYRSWAPFGVEGVIGVDHQVLSKCRQSDGRRQ